MKVIRASEIGTYQFCKRAWWYQLQGYESENQRELAGGIETHHSHGKMVKRGSTINILAIVSLILGLLMAAIWIMQGLL